MRGQLLEFTVGRWDALAPFVRSQLLVLVALILKRAWLDEGGEAARTVFFQQVKSLLEAGGDVHARDQHGCQPLHWAARGGHPEVMRLLMAYGADSRAVDSSGVTALHLYCGEGHLAIVQALVTLEKERLSVKDGRGYTPLDWAIGCGRHKVATWLQEQQQQQQQL